MSMPFRTVLNRAFALDHPAPSLNRPPVLPSTPTTEDSPTSRTSPLSPSDTILPSIPSANKLDQLDPSPYSFYSVTGSQVTPTAPPLPPPQSAPSAVPSLSIGGTTLLSPISHPLPSHSAGRSPGVRRSRHDHAGAKARKVCHQRFELRKFISG